MKAPLKVMATRKASFLNILYLGSTVLGWRRLALLVPVPLAVWLGAGNIFIGYVDAVMVSIVMLLVAAGGFLVGLVVDTSAEDPTHGQG